MWKVTPREKTEIEKEKKKKMDEKKFCGKMNGGAVKRNNKS
jgi:hypothetical protein